MYVSLVYQWEELISSDDLFWYNGDGEMHVFISFHGSTKIEVLDVSTHVLGLGSGQCTVDDQLGSGGVCCGCADISWEIIEMASHSESCPVGFCLLGSVVYTDSAICDILSSVLWDLVMCHEEDGVGTLFPVVYALGQSAQFIGE